jgi:hypothetical protein
LIVGDFEFERQGDLKNCILLLKEISIRSLLKICLLIRLKIVGKMFQRYKIIFNTGRVKQ